ncbi:MAG: HD domain-containing protein [Planctomycetota bacterium]|jgi:hypothetical protein
MEQRQLQGFKRWFDRYIAGFYGDDEFVNANLKLKEDHTRRTCGEMACLTKSLELDENLKRIAETTALFHDIARFEQFTLHRTYNDWMSFNHCERAVEILEEKEILDDLAPDEKQMILKAIEVHGLKELPAELDDKTLLFAKLLRDADKIDIFFWVVRDYGRYKKDPEKFELELEYPDEPWCTPEVVEAILAGQKYDYSRLNTLSDMRIMQLGWVYDINFTASLKRLKKRKLIKGMADFLPNTDSIEPVKNKILEYVDSAIEKNEVEIMN